VGAVYGSKDRPGTFDFLAALPPLVVSPRKRPSLLWRAKSICLRKKRNIVGIKVSWFVHQTTTCMINFLAGGW
jgi:hypothetical protein